MLLKTECILDLALLKKLDCTTKYHKSTSNCKLILFNEITFSHKITELYGLSNNGNSAVISLTLAPWFHRIQVNDEVFTI